jgi:uncharacterized protein YciI
MLFIFVCTDKPGCQPLRLANRAAHLDYLQQFAGALFAAGPTLSDDGETMNGSVLILDFPDRAAAEAFAAGDPYAKAGLFESVIIRPWKKVLPAG